MFKGSSDKQKYRIDLKILRGDAVTKKNDKEKVIFREIMGTKRRFEKMEMSGTKKRETEAKERKIGTNRKKEE